MAKADKLGFINPKVLKAFGCSGSAVLLRGGEGRAYRVGTVVLRKEANIYEANYVAEVFSAIATTGFRISRPIRSRDGDWLVGQWSAWTRLKGSAAQAVDLPILLPAIRAFHEALRHVDKPPYLQFRNSLYDRADEGTWSGCYQVDQPHIERLLQSLEALRKPLKLPEQLIHGDLNPGNFLVEPGELPALIDMAPYWRPVMFSFAVAAYWFGPYLANNDALSAFPSGQIFAQLVLRAAVRSLLVYALTNRDGDADYHRYAQATELVCGYVGSNSA